LKGEKTKLDFKNLLIFVVSTFPAVYMSLIFSTEMSNVFVIRYQYTHFHMPGTQTTESTSNSGRPAGVYSRTKITLQKVGSFRRAITEQNSRLYILYNINQSNAHFLN